VVAEGVETSQEASILSALKCDYAQGYLYSRPLSAKDFEALLN
jgi:EAL domain-containing protein (putative c-di-GMP-specific phosphodiesterase class I)